MLRCTIIFPKSRSVQSHTPFVRVSVCIGRWRHPRSCLGCALQLARALPICTHHGNKNTAKIERGNSQKWTKLQMETVKPPQFCHLFIVTYSSPLFFVQWFGCYLEGRVRTGVHTSPVCNHPATLTLSLAGLTVYSERHMYIRRFRYIFYGRPICVFFHINI